MVIMDLVLVLSVLLLQVVHVVVHLQARAPDVCLGTITHHLHANNAHLVVHVLPIIQMYALESCLGTITIRVINNTLPVIAFALAVSALILNALHVLGDII